MRKLFTVALVAACTLVPANAATAKAKPKAEAFAAKHHLKGAWKGKDADKDGVKNLKEFKLGTDPRKADTDQDGLKDGDELRSSNNPRKADTDGDGVKDGAEHAGTVTAFDGATITIREFATGKKVTAALDTDCTPAAADDEDATADDSSLDDGTVDATEESFGGFFQEDAGDDEGVDADTSSSSCDDDDELEKGVVLQSAELEDGHLVDYVIA